MSTINDAVQQVRQQARTFQAVITVAEALKDVRDLEQHRADAEALVAKARELLTAVQADLAKAEEDLNTMRAQISAAREEHEALKANHEDLRNSVLEPAQAEAHQLLADAQRKADAIAADVKMAEAQHARNMAAHADEEAAAKKRTADAQAEFEALKKRLG